jgi:hypothetical protein
MNRKLSVSISQGSWPLSGRANFPAAFHHGSKTVDLDVSGMLLLVGYLTTPTAAAGVSLSEFWAWVRYFYAVAATPDLRVTNEFANLDSHQKTILSDDFGMGVPMAWLIESLNLVACCDGRYFADRFSALTESPPQTPKKRGPMKCPDFVCLDQNGKYHVIECKGTQSGTATQTRQLSHTTPSGVPSGGIVQKRMIVVQPAYKGQQLACGLTIARENTNGTSNLQIVDPEGDDPIEVDEHEMPLALDPMLRSSVARALRLSGLSVTADIIAAPSGQWPGARDLVGRRQRRSEEARQEFLRDRRGRALVELAERGQEQSFQFQERAYVGREVRLNLPRPLLSDGKTCNSIDIRQGIRLDSLKRLSEGALADLPVMERAPWLLEELDGMKLAADGTVARLFLGELFFSELRLLN